MVEFIPGSRLEQGQFSFFPQGSYGINLLKIHGALDVFTFRNGRDVLKLRPMSPSVAGVLAALKAANEQLLYFDPRFRLQRVHAANEIAYADDQNVMQFLRRSLLAGAFKFDGRVSQVLPSIILDAFVSNLGHVQQLVIIGYGFGDIHINQAIRQWLEILGTRRVMIVSPGARTVPGFLLHLSPQVTLKEQRATDYLEQYALEPLNLRERVMKSVFSNMPPKAGAFT